MSTPIRVVSAVICTVVFMPSAHADDVAHAQGTIVRIAGDRVYVDLGTRNGALPGAPVVLYETVSLTNPQQPRSRPRRSFVPVARAFLVEVGPDIGWARVDPAQLQRVELGGRADLVGAGPSQTVAGPASTAAKAPSGPPRAAVAELLYDADKPLLVDVFDARKGIALTLHHRYDGEQAYQELPLKPVSVAHHAAAIPASEHAGRTFQWYVTAAHDGRVDFVVGNPAQPRETQSKQATARSVAAPKRTQVSPAKRARDLGFRHVPPASVVRGDVLGFSVFAPSPLARPRLHYRVGDTGLTYERVPLTPQPNSYYAYDVPPEHVAGSRIDYYLTVEDADGTELIAVGNPELPENVEVATDVFDAGAQSSRYRGNRHRLSAFGEVVSFGGDEFYAHWEADYLYRLFTVLYRLRMGLGSYNGQGYSPLGGQPIDPDSQDTTGVAFYYGYTEFEWRFHAYFSVLTKLMLGINNDGVGVGFEGFIRVGDELGLNLEIGGLRAASLGTAGIFRLNIPAGEDWMFAGSVWIENLPVDEETGFRMALDANWLVTEDVSLQLRLGLAARAVDRIGPNVGFGVAGHF